MRVEEWSVNDCCDDSPSCNTEQTTKGYIHVFKNPNQYQLLPSIHENKPNFHPNGRLETFPQYLKEGGHIGSYPFRGCITGWPQKKRVIDE